MSTPALNPLVDKIRAAHPGAYDDMDDATLTKRVLAKYPQYSDLAAPKIQPPQVNMQESGIGNAFTPIHGGAGSLGPGNPEANPGMGAAGGTGLALGAGAMGAAATLPFLKTVATGATKFAAKHPLVTMAAIEAAKKLPGTAGQVAGKIPSWLPFLAGHPEAAAEDEAAGSTDQLPGRPYKPNPRYEAPPKPEPVPPRNGPLLLEGEVARTPPVSRKQVSSAVDDSLGVTPQKPNEPIYKRPPFMPQAPDAATVPEGHTPVDSSALSSYKYDPQANELHVEFKSNPGKVHVYGDVNPQEGQEFSDAESKGKAFQKFKKGSYPRVATIINGKRTPTKPGATDE